MIELDDFIRCGESSESLESPQPLEVNITTLPFVPAARLVVQFKWNSSCVTWQDELEEMDPGTKCPKSCPPTLVSSEPLIVNLILSFDVSRIDRVMKSNCSFEYSERASLLEYILYALRYRGS